MSTIIIDRGKQYIASEDDKKGGFFTIHPDDDDEKLPVLVGVPRKGKIDWEGFRSGGNMNTKPSEMDRSPSKEMDKFTAEEQLQNRLAEEDKELAKQLNYLAQILECQPSFGAKSGAKAAKTLHEAISRISTLERWINDLHSGMYINCVYCGHCYGPNTEVPASMAEVLKEHISKCPAHPLSTATKRISILEQERDEALCLAEGPSTLREVASECGRARMNEYALEQKLEEARKIFSRFKDRLDTRLNNHLYEMKDGYDDSITGFNEAWDVMRKFFAEETSILHLTPKDGERT